MCQVAVKIPDAVLFDTHMTAEQTDSFVKQTLALHYYIKCHISLGYCAEIAGMTKEEAADAAVKAVKELSVRVGIPQHLSELGIKAEDLPRLAKAAYADVCTPGNPREVTEEIILELYKKTL